MTTTAVAATAAAAGQAREGLAALSSRRLLEAFSVTGTLVTTSNFNYNLFDAPARLAEGTDTHADLCSNGQACGNLNGRQVGCPVP